VLVRGDVPDQAAQHREQGKDDQEATHGGVDQCASRI
jgi:hypothetical protein